MKAKYAFNSNLLFPQFSILDPETTMSLPTRQTANGVVDSFVHVCEQYLTVCLSITSDSSHDSQMLTCRIATQRLFSTSSSTMSLSLSLSSS